MDEDDEMDKYSVSSDELNRSFESDSDEDDGGKSISSHTNPETNFSEFSI